MFEKRRAVSKEYKRLQFEGSSCAISKFPGEKLDREGANGEPFRGESDVLPMRQHLKPGLICGEGARGHVHHPQQNGNELPLLKLNQAKTPEDLTIN